jgi:predicted glycosyltransferase
MQLCNVGDGATMATEAAKLGTPVIYVSTTAGTMGNFNELQEAIWFIVSYRDQQKQSTKQLN